MADATNKEPQSPQLGFFLQSTDLAVAKTITERLGRTAAVFAVGGLSQAMSWCGEHDPR